MADFLRDSQKLMCETSHEAKCFTLKNEDVVVQRGHETHQKSLVCKWWRQDLTPDNSVSEPTVSVTKMRKDT